MEPKICKCCEAPLKNDVCDYFGVSYGETYASEKIVESVYNTKCSQLSDFLNGDMKPFCGRPVWKATK